MDRLAERKKRIRKIAYSPLAVAATFHRSTARFKGFSGSIGSGKSAALCHEAIKLTYLNPGRTGLVGAPTYPMLRDATLTALTEILDANDIPYELNKSEFVITMKDTDREFCCGRWMSSSGCEVRIWRGSASTS